jgi:hypothetical protein
MTGPLRSIEIKAFVPARDFALSKRYYEALGFEIAWSGEDLACVRHGGTSFLLQALHVPQHTANFQMHLLVENVDDWHARWRAERIAERFGVEIGAPQDQPWGMRDFILFDPSGVLWRVAHNLPQEDTP